MESGLTHLPTDKQKVNGTGGADGCTLLLPALIAAPEPTFAPEQWCSWPGSESLSHSGKERAPAPAPRP